MYTRQHDPRTKQQIKDLLFLYLYTPVKQQFKNRIDDLIMRNALICGYSHKSFSYKGEFYSCDILPLLSRKNKLVPQLRPEMDKYLKDLEELNNNEIPYVLGFINQVLNSSDSFADYLQIFPSIIHYPLQKMIATNPCTVHQLDQNKIDQLKEKNEKPIRLINRRMSLNLLI